MADETKIQTEAAVEAPAKVAKAIADTVEAAANETAKTAKRARAASKRRSKRAAKPAVAARKTRASKTARRSTRTTRTAARKPAAAAFNQRIQDMNFTATNAFPGFEAFTGTTPFQ